MLQIGVSLRSWLKISQVYQMRSNVLCQAKPSSQKYRKQSISKGREHSHTYRRFNQSGGWTLLRSGRSSLPIGFVKNIRRRAFGGFLCVLLLCFSHCCSFFCLIHLLGGHLRWSTDRTTLRSRSARAALLLPHSFGGGSPTVVYDIISSAMSGKKCTPSSGATSVGTLAFTFVDGP